MEDDKFLKDLEIIINEFRLKELKTAIERLEKLREMPITEQGDALLIESIFQLKEEKEKIQILNSVLARTN